MVTAVLSNDNGVQDSYLGYPKISVDDCCPLEARDFFLKFWAESELRRCSLLSQTFVLVNLKVCMDNIIVCTMVLSRKWIIVRLFRDFCLKF